MGSRMGSFAGLCLDLDRVCYVDNCQSGEVCFPFPAMPPSAFLVTPPTPNPSEPIIAGARVTLLQSWSLCLPLSATAGWRADVGRTRLFFATLPKKVTRWGSWAGDCQVGPVAPLCPLELPSSLWSAEGEPISKLMLKQGRRAHLSLEPKLETSIQNRVHRRGSVWA